MKINKQFGFTLIELIIVIMILGIIAGIGAKILNQAFSAYFANQNLVEADWQARLALERMSRDIRAIRSANDITTATSSQFVFTDTNGNAITYSLSGTTLNRQNNASTPQPLATGIQSLAFSYFDKNAVTTAVNTNISYITITLNITLNNTNFNIVTSVNPRNVL